MQVFWLKKYFFCKKVQNTCSKRSFFSHARVFPCRAYIVCIDPFSKCDKIRKKTIKTLSNDLDVAHLTYFATKTYLKVNF